MVVVTETEQGKPWAGSCIKALTGGDKISARVMRGDPFEFSPVFKLWIAGNHRPDLRNPDKALVRRLNLIPMCYVPPTPDTTLTEELMAEASGILAWAIQGCLDWQRNGLQPPETIKTATAEYFNEQDMVAQEPADRGDAG
jgi:putative DNA primase/helicase